ncbi:SMC-Scp complex subunit ScpB [Christensenellaceae bacterium OttesenSCG-928-L17]|nr:SMC-Scp complex subunit ScpB [Christensenellaceae bacterium OttesenSCG-928-L17]
MNAKLQDWAAAVECMLFVAGDPVPLSEIQRVLGITEAECNQLLEYMKEMYACEKRGMVLSITDETMQLHSNGVYAHYVEQLLQPTLKKTFSSPLLETLAVIAYRQPVTRADIEAVRGVRCEYAVSQLLKMNMVQPVGRKDVVGRPMLLGTTDAFLHHFGVQNVIELPNYDAYKAGAEIPEDTLTV